MGNILLPKTQDFPSFSETGCIEHIDDILAFAPKDDISGLNSLLVIFSFLPGGTLKWIIKKMGKSHSESGSLSVIFRQLDFGLKGIIYTCYYSGKTGKNFTGRNPHKIIGFEFKRVMD